MIRQYFEESERSLDRFQKMFDDFITVAAVEEKDPQKAQNAYDPNYGLGNILSISNRGLFSI